ncbi:MULTISPECIES: fimbrial protein [unclassified Erwinia]|uniref:fimbrial protein n=1 Tax=unclassified Erwinia TaxID=2622719 RepID=UPI000701B1FF|nr:MULTISPECIES: fimbrial protein [unclassified Erwinia]KQN53877.1 fimbria A protein [Erwinia sp. Leaf53]PLV62354.1 fimbria A protein [Erwinia sp. B116]
MKLNKIMLAAAMTFGSLSMAQAANQGGGQISFSGSIIDAPCSIANESLKQDIQLGAISNAMLKTGKHSTPVDINIKLENCEFGETAKKNNVTVTFTGNAAAEDSKMLALTGNSSDAGIMFEDQSGTKLNLGSASQSVKLAGDQTLNFKAYVQATKSSSPSITPGDFTAVANFQMAYE